MLAHELHSCMGSSTARSLAASRINEATGVAFGIGELPRRPGLRILSRLNGQPARSPADACKASSRTPHHGSRLRQGFGRQAGPARVATASPYGSLIHYSPPADTVPELSMAERSGPLTARRSEVVDNSAAQMFRSVGKLPDPLNRRVVCHAAMWLRSPSSFPAKDNFRFVVHLPFDRLRAVRGLERRISELGFRIGELGFSGLSRWGVGLVLVLESCGRKAHAWQCVGVGRGRSDVVLEGGKSS